LNIWTLKDFLKNYKRIAKKDFLYVCKDSYHKTCTTDVVIVVKIELHSAIPDCSSALGVIEVQDARRKTSLKKLTARQRHGARAAFTGFREI